MMRCASSLDDSLSGLRERSIVSANLCCESLVSINRSITLVLLLFTFIFLLLCCSSSSLRLSRNYFSCIYIITSSTKAHSDIPHLFQLPEAYNHFTLTFIIFYFVSRLIYIFLIHSKLFSFFISL